MITLPWKPATAPHLVLEINAVCNIACNGCYKRMTGTHKPVGQVMDELDLAARQRAVHTVTLAGGEPTLHPDLGAIVRRIRARGFKCALLTNGTQLGDDQLRTLAAAGLNLVQLHIDEGQRRPDLPDTPTVADIHALRDAIAQRVVQHGMDVGLCVTLYPDPVERVTALVDYVTRSPWVDFLFASHYFDPADFMRAFTERDHAWHPQTTNSTVLDTLRQARGLVPFACLRSPDEVGTQAVPGWLTYLVPVLRKGADTRYLRVTSTRADMWPFHLGRLFAGRFVFYCKPASTAIMIHVLLNGLCTGRIGQAFGFVARGMRPGATAGCKRMVFDNGPRIMTDGRTECAELCPNATVRNGKLCGICTADLLEDAT